MSRRLSRRSLRLRLMVGLLTAQVLIWLTLLGFHWSDTTREVTGEWDIGLATLGQMVLMTLPQGLAPITASSGYGVADRDQVPPDLNDPALQAFSLKDGRMLLRSPNAPFVPLVASRQDGLRTTQADGKSWRAYVITDANRQVQVQVGKPVAQLQAELHERMMKSLAAMTLLCVAMAIVVWAILQAALAPIRGVSAALHARQALDLEPLSAHGVPDEITPLVGAFNQQLRRVETALKNERQFLQDAAHELRTPLAAVSVQAENALRSDDWVEMRRSVQKIFDAAQRSARMSEQLLDMARMEAAGEIDFVESVDLSQVTAAVVNEYRAKAAHRMQTLRTDIAPCIVAGHLDTLGVLLRNLLDNAVRYSGDGAHIRVHCGKHADTHTPMLAVVDDGPGVTEEARARVLDRFYRAPGNSDHGSGIGLSLVDRIATLHGARIEIGTGPAGTGFAIAVHFPAARPAKTAAKEKAQDQRQARVI